MTQPESQPQAEPPGFLAGLFFLALSAFGWFGLRTNHALWNSIGAPGLDPGPGVLPLIVCSFLTLGGAFLVVAGLLRRNPGLVAMSPHRLVVPVLFLFSAGLAAIAIPVLGFMAPASVFAWAWLAVLSRAFGPPLVRIGLSAILAAAMVILIRAVFVALLRVPLP